jgi:N-acetylglucosamine-6-sulfatase
MHNTKVTGNSCGGADFKNGPEKLNVAHYAKTKGYTNFYGGKYLNNYGNSATGGVEYIPQGWDSWFALVGNSKYYGYTVSNNGVAEKHGDDYFQDYFTDYLANKSVAFVNNVTGPFFVMIGTPACHIPDDYAPWTENLFNGTLAPRTPNWNVCPNLDKHAMMRGIQPMQVGDPAVDGHSTEYGSDWVHIKRLRTLQSVDVMVERLVHAVDAKGQLGNTYFLLSSDNGYHLGQFGLGYDKRQMYEEDIRVPVSWLFQRNKCPDPYSSSEPSLKSAFEIPCSIL